MKILLAGTRGSACVSGADVVEFGGDTTCVVVRGRRGGVLILDAGTGLRRAAEWLEEIGGPRVIPIFLSHLHLDHIIGLLLSPLLYRRGVRVTIYHPSSSHKTLEWGIKRVFSRPVWPIGLDELRATVSVRRLPRREHARCRVGEFLVKWVPVEHPGGCFAYRVENVQTSIVFATDIEWSRASSAKRKRFIELLSNPTVASCLIIDGQWDDDERERYQGWGHSALADLVEIAARSRIPKVIVTHHSPEKDDRALRKMEKAFQKVVPGSVFGRDGMVVEV